MRFRNRCVWLALVAVLAACEGSAGQDGANGASCAVVDNDDGSKTVTCGTTTVTVHDGSDGQDGQGCTAEKIEGVTTITCGDQVVTVTDGSNGTNGTNGVDGTNGTDGQDGAACTVAKADGVTSITCGDQVVTVTDGANGQDGTNGTNGTNGQDGAACTVAKADGVTTITCGDQVVTVTDGANGQDGTNGANGQDGAAGVACWDLDGDGLGDPLTEDANGDGLVNVADCKGAPGDPAVAASNALCLTAACHGDPTLSKKIITASGGTETIPLYVDEALFAATVHGDQKCAACHNDINAAGGAHAPVAKTYGGWARFSASQAVEAFATHEVVRTRNYYTAAARSCPTCHTEQGGYEYSAHAITPKQRAAHIDAELTAIATTEEGKATTIGEDYELGNCNRCHASCATCHFKSMITRKNSSAAPITDFWDQVQATDSATGFNANMSEFQMDWTTNVVSHDFRAKDYFASDPEGVCEACHTGFQRPAGNAYYWLDEVAGTWAKVKATNVKRHPQATELAISGDPALSAATGGANTAHAAFACADCHGTASSTLGAAGNIHGLPGLPYKWSDAGDVQCESCHADYVHAEGTVDLHVNGSFSKGTRVACIGCHTFGLARDFEIATNGTSSSHEVFLDPKTGEVRPVVKKNGHAIAWYSHNWQTLNPGTGRTDPAGGCAQKCHYDGNLVGAGF